jgi:chemotaxis protein MotB
MTNSRLFLVGLFAAVGSVVISTGCVSKGQYSDVEAQRDSVSAVSAQQQAELQQLHASYDSLNTLFAAEMQEKDLEIVQLATGISVTIPADLLYASGAATATIGDEGREMAMKLADYLKGTTFYISVVGHTDSQKPIGSLAQKYPTNWELAAARAANAVEFLQSQGVDPDRMAAVSKGQYDPVASNSTADGRAQNRRIEVILRTLPDTDD